MGSFLIVRHAQSVWNAQGRWQGHADPPLSDEGRAQAARAAETLDAGDYDLVVSSDLTRARMTAEILAGHLGLDRPVRTVPALRELDVGAWSGLTREDIERRWPESVSLFDRGVLGAPPGGESRETFDRRISGATRAVAAMAAEHRATRLLIVAHGGVVRSVARLAGLEELRIGHLSGYRGQLGEHGLVPLEAVDLLEPTRFPDHPYH